MAKIGLKNFRYAFLTEANDGTASYGGAKQPGKAIDCEVSVENNDVKLYADDVVQESDTSFSGGTVNITLDRDDYQVHADLLGHTYEDGVLTRNAGDVAPYIGFGRIISLLQDNVRCYKVEILKKVKMSEPSQNDTTKGETVEFNTVSMEGSIATLADGSWSISKMFDSHEDALAFLEEQLGGDTPSNTYTVSYNVNGGEGTISPVTVTAGESITLDDGSGLTPPAGKTSFVGWAKSAGASSATVTSPFTPTKDETLYAVWAD